MTERHATLVEIDGVVRQLDVSGPPTATATRFEFFANIIRDLIDAHGFSDRRWFVTYDGTADLPTLDERCVVFVYGDERSLLPVRYREAGLILKAMGCEPYTTERPRADLASVLDRLRLARNRLLNRRLERQVPPGELAELTAKILPFPLGYSRQKALPLKPLAERRHLIWFSGSLLNAGGSALALKRRMADEPKRAARQRMIAALRRLQARHPDWAIETDVLPTFADSLVAPAGYSEHMMDTKIAVVPRGTVAETQRFHEAMRAGCVVICEPLPDFWFYRGAPRLELADWSKLPELVEGLVAAPGRLQALHEAACRWWRDVCSPPALATTIAAILGGEASVDEVRRSSADSPPKRSRGESRWVRRTA